MDLTFNLFFLSVPRQALLIALGIIQGAGILAAWKAGRQAGGRLSIFNLCSTSFSGWGVDGIGIGIANEQGSGGRQQERVWMRNGEPGWDGMGPDCNPLECMASVAYKF